MGGWVGVLLPHLVHAVARDVDRRDRTRDLALLLDVLHDFLVLVVGQHVVRDEPTQLQARRVGGRRRRRGGRAAAKGPQEVVEQRVRRVLARCNVSARPCGGGGGVR
eukprot:6394363-Prymnesium_polylepis.2